MPLLPAALLVISLAAIAWITWRDVGQYAKFKQLTDTRDRQARYRRWVLNAFALFVGGSLAILAILGQLGGVIHPPQAFAEATRWAQAVGPSSEAGPLLLGGMTGGAATGVIIASVVATIVARRRRGAAMKTRTPGTLTPQTITPQTITPQTITLGDVAPLMPRNNAETVWTGLLSVNAGVGEELFFRLTLPLLIALVTGSAVVAFAAAAIIFGLVHIYQGWVGVVATMLLGAAFTAVYLITGSIFWPMAFHAIFDLLGLVVRPTIVRLATQRG